MQMSNPLTKIFIGIQRKLKPNITIEVGAYDAHFSKIMAKGYNKPGTTWAFERHPEIFEKFLPEMEGIHYRNNIVSDKIGVQTMYQYEGGELQDNNSMLPILKDTNYTTFEVPSITLDGFFPNEENICLWIDCEGANREVLNGAQNVLQRTSSIFIEVDNVALWQNQWLWQETFAFLKDAGFACYARDFQYRDHWNAIFVKKEL
jgi:FkbM family methyltransferase